MAAHRTDNHHLLVSTCFIDLDDVRCCITDPPCSGQTSTSKFVNLQTQVSLLALRHYDNLVLNYNRVI